LALAAGRVPGLRGTIFGDEARRPDRRVELRDPRAPDNAAVELVDDGENGFVVEDRPQAVADAIVRVVGAGPALRERTADWFGAHARELSVQASLERVVARYAERRA
jgi:hypothetical protein